MRYVVLLRGVNVGGKNKVPMADLKRCLEGQGLDDVRTYIQSGNVVLNSSLPASEVAARIGQVLPREFDLDRQVLGVVALEEHAYKAVVSQAPDGFGADTDKYRYYVLFPIGTSTAQAIKEIDTRPGVDSMWQGEVAIYYRLPSLKSPDAGKSWLTRVAQKPIYQSLTMRNWSTTVKLLHLLEQMPADRRGAKNARG